MSVSAEENLSWNTIYDKGYAAFKKQDYKTAQALFLQGEALLKPKGDSLDLASCYFWLAASYRDQERILDTENLLNKSLSIYERLLAKQKATNADLFAVLEQLGDIYMNEGHFAKAELILKRAFDINEADPLKDATYTGAMFRLARAYYKQGKYDLAEPLFKKAIAIDERNGESARSSLATDVESLGRLYYRQGLYAKAEPMYKRALALREKKGGAYQDSDYAFLLNYLADLYDEQDRFAEAEPLYEQALLIAEKTLPSDDPQLAVYMCKMAQIYREQNKNAEAEALYKRATTVVEKSGNKHEALIGTLTKLAGLYVEQRRFTEAAPLLDRALSIAESNHGVDSPDYAEILYDLAVVCEDQGAHAKALKLFEKAVNVLGKQPDVPSLANEFNSLGVLHQKQDQYAEAEPYFKRARAVDRRYYGQRESATLVQLEAEKEQLMLAQFCLQRLNARENSSEMTMFFVDSLPSPDASREVWQRNADVVKSALAKISGPTKSAKYAEGLEVFAFSSLMANPDALIIPDLLKALAIKDNVLGAASLSTIETRLHLALYFQSLGGFSYQFADECRDMLFKHVADLAHPADLTSADGGALAVAADNAATKRIYLQELSEDLFCLAYIYAGIDTRYAEAKEVADKAVFVNDRLSAPGEKVEFLLKVAVLYELTGEYGPAREALTQAQQLCLASNDDGRGFTVQIALARLALMQADYETATDCAQLALKLGEKHFGANAEALLECYELLGQSEAGIGRLTEAIRYTREVMTAAPLSHGAEASRAATQTQLGILLTEAKKWPEAEQNLKQALAATQGINEISQRIQSARTYSALGSLYGHQNLNQQAANNYAKAVDIFRRNLKKEIVPAYVRAINGNAVALAALGEKETARAEVFTSADTIKQYIDRVFSQLSFGEQCAFVKLADEESGALFAICKDDKSSIEKAYAYAAGWKGLLVGSLTVQSKLLQNARQNPNLVSIINELNSKRRLLAGVSQRALEDSQTVAKQLEGEVEALEQRLQREGGLSMNKPLPLVEQGTKFISDKLRPEEAFVDIVQIKTPDDIDTALGAAVISKSGFQFVDLGLEASITHLVNDWRSSVTGEVLSESSAQEISEASSTNGRGPRDVQIADALTVRKASNVEDYVDATNKLRSEIWTKITSVLPNSVNKINLCSEGALARIPWSAIAPGGVLVSEVDSPSEFITIQNRSRKIQGNPKILVAGNIAFNDPEKRVTELNGTKVEIEEIERLAKEHQFAVFALDREDATKAAVTKALSDVSFAHLATHGFTRSTGRDPGMGRAATISIGATSRTYARNPLLDTGLFLAFPKGIAGGSTQEEPGILTASEIVGLDLSSCDLVSLSACQTGLGRDLGGQGVVGLRSAIIAAGARSVLMSLWKVDDEATQELMHEFYKNLWAGGRNKAEALKLAQESIRTNKRHPEWAKPRYWAAWTIVGQSW